jgi:hypothetical protein
MEAHVNFRFILLMINEIIVEFLLSISGEKMRTQDLTSADEQSRNEIRQWGVP